MDITTTQEHSTARRPNFLKSARAALATHFGMDMSDLKDYTYQPGRFTRAVYYVDNAFWCAVKANRHLPKRTRLMEDDLDWKEIPDKLANENGWKIFTATSSIQ